MIPHRSARHTIDAFQTARRFEFPACPPHITPDSPMWFKNLRIYRLAPSWDLAPDALEDALAKLEFRPGGASDMTTFGWTAPRPESGLVHVLDGQLLLNLRVEKKL